MRTKSLFERVVIDLCVVVAAALLILGSIVGYAWIKERPRRAESRKQTEALLADSTAQRNGLIALGEVNLDPSNLTLADLQQKLHQPAFKQPGPQNTTNFGWACGVRRCAVRASFLVPFGKEIPPDMTPVALMVTSPLLGDFHNVALGGVHLGDKVEMLREICQKRGYGRQIGYNRVSWGEEWGLMWVEVHGKIIVLVLTDENMMKNFKAQGDGNVSGLTSIRKGDAK